MKRVVFTALPDPAGSDPADGTFGWSICIDGVDDICQVESDELDVGDNALSPLWKALGIEIKFKFE